MPKKQKEDILTNPKKKKKAPKRKPAPEEDVDFWIKKEEGLDEDFRPIPEKKVLQRSIKEFFHSLGKFESMYPAPITQVQPEVVPASSPTSPIADLAVVVPDTPTRPASPEPVPPTPEPAPEPDPDPLPDTQPVPDDADHVRKAVKRCILDDVVDYANTILAEQWTEERMQEFSVRASRLAEAQGVRQPQTFVSLHFLKKPTARTHTHTYTYSRYTLKLTTPPESRSSCGPRQRRGVYPSGWNWASTRHPKKSSSL